MSQTKEAALEAKIREGLPQDVQLRFKVIESYLTIKPTTFLGSDNFSKLQAKIRELGGEYVSAGKQSHFRFFLGSKDSSDLEDWYARQKPPPLTLVLNLNLQVSSPQQLEEYLKALKKSIQGETKNG